jgi:Co/Zn/Cd efflux system component
MSVCCSHCNEPSPQDRARNAAYRRILWLVLAINAGMFLVEIIAGLAAGSASLQADALDFLADAANYGISLLVIGLALRYRAMAALTKGLSMGGFGLWVIATVIWHATHRCVGPCCRAQVPPACSTRQRTAAGERHIFDFPDVLTAGVSHVEG